MYIAEIEVSAGDHVSFVDITEKVREILMKSEIRDGILHIYSRHTTAGIRINENEEYLLRDFKRYLEELVPEGQYEHDNFEVRVCPPDERVNARSHIAHLLMGASETVPFSGGELLLGQWQSIFFVDLDGDRKVPRNVVVTVKSA